MVDVGSMLIQHYELKNDTKIKHYIDSLFVHFPI